MLISIIFIFDNESHIHIQNYKLLSWIYFITYATKCDGLKIGLLFPEKWIQRILMLPEYKHFVYFSLVACMHIISLMRDENERNKTEVVNSSSSISSNNKCKSRECIQAIDIIW